MHGKKPDKFVRSGLVSAERARVCASSGSILSCGSAAPALRRPVSEGLSILPAIVYGGSKNINVGVTGVGQCEGFGLSRSPQTTTENSARTRSTADTMSLLPWENQTRYARLSAERVSPAST